MSETTTTAYAAAAASVPPTDPIGAALRYLASVPEGPASELIDVLVREIRAARYRIAALEKACQIGLLHHAPPAGD